MAKRYLLTALGVVFVSCAWAVQVAPEIIEAEKARIAVIEKVTPAVIAVMRKGGAGGGSGVLISPDGYALTNFHVTSAAGDEMHCGLPDGKLYDAIIVGIDPTGDVAVIKLRGRDDFPYAPMGDSDELEVGDWALAMGNPFMLATDFKPTVTFGIISGLHRYQYPGGRGLLEYPDCIQVDASINPGNSGGPTFNLKGEVIGINGRISFEKRSRVNSGFGYAISINQIKNFLHALRGGRVVDHATLGATVGTDEHGRVVVREILAESDAYRRGLRDDDEVVSLAGRPVTTVNEFKNVLGTLPWNWRVPLIVHRGTDRVELLVRLSGQHGAGWDFAAQQQRRHRHLQPKPKDPNPPKEEKPGEEKPDGPAPEDDQPEEKGDEEDGAGPEEGEGEKPEQEEGEEEAPEPEKADEKKPAPQPANKPGLIEKRPGFSNFVFNRKEQDRVLSAYTAFYRKKADALSISPWTLRGRVGRVPFRAQLDFDAGMLQIAETDFVVTREDLLGPAGDDGIAVLGSLMLWRAFLIKGKDAFKDTRYEGRAPTPLGLCDVLVTTIGPIRVQWYFLPETGSLQLFEVRFERNTDPYEFLLGKYEDHEDLLLPSVLLVRVGDDFIGKFAVAEYELTKSEE